MYIPKLAEKLKSNTKCRELILSNCGLDDACCEHIAEVIANNKTLTSLDLEANRCGNDGATALAKALASNRGLITLNLLDQRGSRFGDSTLAAFINAFDTNITLLKIIWRVESRQSFRLNKMLVRNNEIDRRIFSNMGFEDLLPKGVASIEPSLIKFRAEVRAGTASVDGSGKNSSQPTSKDASKPGASLSKATPVPKPEASTDTLPLKAAPASMHKSAQGEIPKPAPPPLSKRALAPPIKPTLAAIPADTTNPAALAVVRLRSKAAQTSTVGTGDKSNAAKAWPPQQYNTSPRQTTALAAAPSAAPNGSSTCDLAHAAPATTTPWSTHPRPASAAAPSNTNRPTAAQVVRPSTAGKSSVTAAPETTIKSTGGKASQTSSGAGSRRHSRSQGGSHSPPIARESLAQPSRASGPSSSAAATLARARTSTASIQAQARPSMVTNSSHNQSTDSVLESLSRKASLVRSNAHSAGPSVNGSAISLNGSTSSSACASPRGGPTSPRLSATASSSASSPHGIPSDGAARLAALDVEQKAAEAAALAAVRADFAKRREALRSEIAREFAAAGTSPASKTGLSPRESRPERSPCESMADLSSRASASRTSTCRPDSRALGAAAESSNSAQKRISRPVGTTTPPPTRLAHTCVGRTVADVREDGAVDAIPLDFSGARVPHAPPAPLPEAPSRFTVVSSRASLVDASNLEDCATPPLPQDAPPQQRAHQSGA
mmetsp:Transcript_19565/g.59209  ORF Transcript_19565/g.59209 Transcript_19565/m.59209 type:complete len:722 (+) Transcript_19565:164-2329(+)